MRKDIVKNEKQQARWNDRETTKEGVHKTEVMDEEETPDAYINTFNTQYVYSDTQQMTRDLTNQAYAFISGGWHDTRTICPQY